MAQITSKLTVFFEDPFWVGVLERTHGRTSEVCKITFGAEPKDYEVYAFMLQHWHRLRFSPSVEGPDLTQQHISPKRMQRIINAELHNTGIGTKAQQALKLQHEQTKLEHKSRTRMEQKEEQERQFLLRQKKRKEKHRGH